MRKWQAAILACALSAIAGWTYLLAADDPPLNVPGVPPATIANPDLAIRQAAQFSSTWPSHQQFLEADLEYVRYVSFYRAPADKLADWTRRLMRFWLNQLSFNQSLSYAHEVPGTNGRLFWLDLRDFDWNYRAWRSVAERDLYLAEPWIDHENAELLRRLHGVELSAATKLGRRLPAPGGKTTIQMVLPSGVVIDGMQLLRDTLESNRNPSYYDLLFAKQRFPFKEDFVDFPKDEDDWNSAFGTDLVRKFALKQHIDLDFGAVVEGGKDNPATGSIVALNNRLLATVFGPFGASMETYDVKETSGVRDFSESLIFAGKGFTKGQGAQAVRDAGELLAYLPNGGQAGLLVNGENKRIETADAQFAKDTTEAPTSLESRVRNYGSCLVCHSPAGGYIIPRDLMKLATDDGIAAKFKDHDQYLRVKAFFHDYSKKIKGIQEPYLDVLAETTRGDKKDDKGWTGAQLSAAVKSFRDYYDAPLDAAAAAADLGEPVDAAKRQFALSPFNRMNQLLQGQKIPRTTWEKDALPNTQILRQVYVDEGAGKKPMD